MLSSSKSGYLKSSSWRVKSLYYSTYKNYYTLKEPERMTKLKYSTARTMTMFHLSWFYILLFILCSHWIQSTCAFTISSQGFQTTIYDGPFRSPDSVSKRLFPQWTRQSQFYATTNNKEEETKTTTFVNSEDIPRPTEAGGYSHTSASKAKISAANKGKTPWNKGKARSEEVKQRIAEGVRRKNRERFLLKLQEMGITEEEYEAKKKEERRIKDAERRARKTENGGYRPTEETKAKISKILKEKFANGEIKKREYKGPFRKGFTHSEETRAKISQTLKKKWAEVCLFGYVIGVYSLLLPYPYLHTFVHLSYLLFYLQCNRILSIKKK